MRRFALISLALLASISSAAAQPTLKDRLSGWKDKADKVVFASEVARDAFELRGTAEMCHIVRKVMTNPFEEPHAMDCCNVRTNAGFGGITGRLSTLLPWTPEFTAKGRMAGIAWLTNKAMAYSEDDLKEQLNSTFTAGMEATRSTCNYALKSFGSWHLAR